MPTLQMEGMNIRIKKRIRIGAVAGWMLATASLVWAAGLPAPEIQAPADGAVFTLAAVNQGQVVLQWKAVTGAARYEVQIAGPPEYGIRTFLTQTGQNTLVFPQTTAAGFYYWRVRAVDAQSQPGAYSKRRILYIGVQPDALMPLDLFRDNRIDELDLLLFFKYARENALRGDLDGDNRTTGKDLLRYSAAWQSVYTSK
jgi:hypothetical protein